MGCQRIWGAEEPEVLRVLEVLTAFAVTKSSVTLRDTWGFLRVLEKSRGASNGPGALGGHLWALGGLGCLGGAGATPTSPVHLSQEART